MILRELVFPCVCVRRATQSRLAVCRSRFFGRLRLENKFDAGVQSAFYWGLLKLMRIAGQFPANRGTNSCASISHRYC